MGGRGQLERNRLGQEAGFHGKTLGGEAEVGQARFGRSRQRHSPVGSPVQGAPSSLTVRSDEARQRGGEDEPEIVEGGREGQDLEVRDGDDPLLRGDDDRVALGRIELDRELRLHVVEDVAAGALDLGQVPERQRILEVAGRTRRPRSRCRSSSSPRRSSVRRSPGYGRTSPIAAWSIVGFAARPSRLSAPADVHRVEERDRVGDGEGRPAGRERVVVEERRALAGLERQPVEQGGGEVGERREIGLADRPDRPDGRRLAAVQRGNDAVRQLRPNAGRALGEVVGEAEHRRADDVVGSVRALADDVVPVHRAGVAVGASRP